MKKENKKTGNIKIDYKIKPFGEKKLYRVKLNEIIYEDTSILDLFDSIFDCFEEMFDKQTIDEYIYWRNRYDDIEKLDEMKQTKVKPKNQKIKDVINDSRLLKSIKDEMVKDDQFFKELLTSYLNYNYKNKKEDII